MPDLCRLALVEHGLSNHVVRHTLAAGDQWFAFDGKAGTWRLVVPKAPKPKDVFATRSHEFEREART